MFVAKNSQTFSRSLYNGERVDKIERATSMPGTNVITPLDVLALDNKALFRDTSGSCSARDAAADTGQIAGMKTGYRGKNGARACGGLTNEVVMKTLTMTARVALALAR